MSSTSSTRAELSAVFEQLHAGAVASPQQRGKLFERLLHDLLALERLSPRTSFRPRGEEIDGSFEWHGRFTLLEAKWQADPLPASALYAFKGKVDGKLVGTIGVVFSVSGYSRDAVNALVMGKEINLVLFDGEDIAVVFNGEVTFRHALRRKLRAAAEGTPFYKLDRTRSGARAGGLPLSLAIVEGAGEAALLGALARVFAAPAKLDTVQAGGALNIVDAAQAAVAELSAHQVIDRLIFVVDDDAAPSALDGVLPGDGRSRLRTADMQISTVVLPADLTGLVDNHDDNRFDTGITPVRESRRGRTAFGDLSDGELRDLVGQVPALQQLLRLLGVDHW